jgi:hypothetical protein
LAAIKNTQMKKAFLSVLIILGSIISYSQSKNIVGAWIWRDSKTSFSLFINKDGTIEKHIGPINEPILEKTLKRGTYKFKDNRILIITWADKSSETDTVKFINNATVKIGIKTSERNTIKTYTFKKVIDEEVELPPEN